MKNKLYQMFILGTSGEHLDNALAQGLGGIIFFTNDIQTPKQFKDSITKYKNKAKMPLFLSVDQEGGRVERTENIYGGKKYLSAKYAYENGTSFLQKQSKEIAQELKSYGINLNFAPCIDVNTNSNNPIIGERAFSSNVEDVIQAGKIVCNTYTQNGIIPCLKHYPGHGDASCDSHLTLPKINLSIKEMEEIHIKPFKELKKYAPMIMVAHLYCTCFDNNTIPATLSKNAIDYLRNKIDFNGILISDDMMMKGINCDLTTAIEKGIKAGLNMFIYRNSDDTIITAIEDIAKQSKTDKILAENIENSYLKILEIKKQFLDFS